MMRLILPALVKGSIANALSSKGGRTLKLGPWARASKPVRNRRFRAVRLGSSGPKTVPNSIDPMLLATLGQTWFLKFTGAPAVFPMSSTSLRTCS